MPRYNFRAVPFEKAIPETTDPCKCLFKASDQLDGPEHDMAQQSLPA